MTIDAKQASQPKVLTSEDSRARARHIRDQHWHLMELADQFGVCWFCPWNKQRRDEGPDEIRLCLLGGLEMFDWIRRHQDWFVVGDWDESRYANPVSLTDAGRAALADRERYDMEPVYGGMVEPGWQAIPLPPSEAQA